MPESGGGSALIRKVKGTRLHRKQWALQSPVEALEALSSAPLICRQAN